MFAVFPWPALVLAAAAFIAGRAALPRALALCAVVASVLFCFYGVLATRIWEFFHWRASAVLVLMSLAVGFALAAPLLATGWLRLSWPLRLAVYLPVGFLVVAFIRNATGTDPSLRFALSPWPAVPVFGIEVGALFVMVGLLGAAIGVGGLVRARTRAPRLPAATLGVALGIAAPIGLLALGSALGMLPFRAGSGTLGLVAAGCAVAIVLCGKVGLRASTRCGGARCTSPWARRSSRSRWWLARPGRAGTTTRHASTGPAS